MNIDDLNSAIQNFKKATQNLPTSIHIGSAVTIQAGEFPDKCGELPDQGNGKGVYLLVSNQDKRILYIGKASNGDGSIAARFYDHIGCGFNWSRNNAKAKFPHPKILNKAGIQEEIQSTIINANFSISVCSVTPPEAAPLLESFLIFWAYAHNTKPPLNIEF